MEGGVLLRVLTVERAVHLVVRLGGCSTEGVVVLTPVVTEVTLHKGDTHPTSLQVNQQLFGVLRTVERLPVVNCRGPVITLGQWEVPQGDKREEVRT